MDEIMVYDLPHVLPLTLNRTAHILNQTNEAEELIHQVVLTPMESAALTVLLEAAPRMAPYEDVVQVLRGGERIEVQGRKKRDRDNILAPVRTLLTGLDAKLAPFNLHILAVYETGYLLQPLKGDIPIDRS